MDIETIEFSGKEIPISVSIKTENNLKIFIIDHNQILIDLDMAIADLWNKFFYFINLNCNKEVIFVHNLGSFYGFFIYKGLSNRFKPMPFELIRKLKVIDQNFNLDNFFGYLKVEVKAPKDIKPHYYLVNIRVKPYFLRVGELEFI